MQPTHRGQKAHLMRISLQIFCFMEMVSLILIIYALSTNTGTQSALQLALSGSVPAIIWVSYTFFNFSVCILLGRVFGNNLESQKERILRILGTSLYMSACIICGIAAITRIFEPPNYHQIGIYWILIIIACVLALPAMTLHIIYVRMIVKCIEANAKNLALQSSKGSLDSKITIGTVQQFLLISILNFGCSATIMFVLPIWSNMCALITCPIYCWSVRKVALSSRSMGMAGGATNNNNKQAEVKILEYFVSWINRSR